MHDIAMVVGQNLDFDVARSLDVFFQIDARVLKRLFGFSAGRLEPGSQGDFIPGNSHPFATTAGGGFDQNRVTNSIGDTNSFFNI
jgi:hypothetical protein